MPEQIILFDGYCSTCTRWGRIIESRDRGNKFRLVAQDSEDGEATERHLNEGECALIPGNQYYQLHNETDGNCMLYQVKKPGDQIVIAGKGQLNNKDYFTEGRQKETTL